MGTAGKGRAQIKGSGRPVTAAVLPLKERLEQTLGRLIKESQSIWDDLPKPEREQRVDQYILLYDCLAHITGNHDPVIPSPWTEDEVFDSMRDYMYGGEWLKSTNGMLTVIDSKLVCSVRATERSRRRRKGRE